MDDQKWYCYILRSKDDKYSKCTYNGMTNNPKKRLRQHNGEIKGGARFTTRRGSEWEIYALISGFPDKINCLSCEWRIKNPENRKNRWLYYSPKGKILGLNKVLHEKQWTNQCKVLNETMKLCVWIVPEYSELLIDLPEYIEVKVVDNILDALEKDTLS